MNLNDTQHVIGCPFTVYMLKEGLYVYWQAPVVTMEPQWVTGSLKSDAMSYRVGC